VCVLLRFYLDGVGLLEQIRQLALLGLQVRVPPDVLLIDEDVGDTALVRDFLEGVLDRGAVICRSRVSEDQEESRGVFLKEKTYRLGPTR
jgi:hypothetical protein